MTPLYHVNVLYNQYLGRDRLRTTVSGPTFDSSREGAGVPVLDAVASRSADGSRLYLKVVNTAPASGMETRVEIAGAAIGGQADWHVLTAQSRDAYNSFATPDVIRPRQEVIPAGARFQVLLPPHSVSVIVLSVVPAPRTRSGP